MGVGVGRERWEWEWGVGKVGREKKKEQRGVAGDVWRAEEQRGMVIGREAERVWDGDWQRGREGVVW